MYPASVPAYAFVKKGIEEGNPVTQMKLQKLLFFAHGLSLASLDEPLTMEHFQAWKYGPVIPNIYHEYKLFGSSQIIDTDLISFVDNKAPDLMALDVDATKMIEISWDTLNRFSAIELSNWTHKEGSPWAKYYKADEQYVVIPNPSIKEYFNKFIKK